MGHTAERIILDIEADVVQLVQIAEDTHLCKLRHTGDEDELQVKVGTF